jgi:hypothetical protein
MLCSCGGETSYREHVVRTLKTAVEWYPEAQDLDLPVLVRRDVCTSCGRERKWDMRRRTYKRQAHVYAPDVPQEVPTF